MIIIVIVLILIVTGMVFNVIIIIVIIASVSVVLIIFIARSVIVIVVIVFIFIISIQLSVGEGFTKMLMKMKKQKIYLLVGWNHTFLSEFSAGCSSSEPPWVCQQNSCSLSLLPPGWSVWCQFWMFLTWSNPGSLSGGGQRLVVAGLGISYRVFSSVARPHHWVTTSASVLGTPCYCSMFPPEETVDTLQYTGVLFSV